MPEVVRIDGLDELRKELKSMGDVEGTKEFKAAGYRAAAEVVIPGARQRAASRGQVRAAATLSPTKTASGGAVRFGAGFVGAFGFEFGAAHNLPRNTSRGVMRGWNQFPLSRGSGSGAGYFLWPTIREDAEEIVAVIDDALEPLFARAFPDRR